MLVAMMRIGVMRMAVRQRCVLMSMAMRFPRRIVSSMCMLVVFVMGMHVVVVEPFMLMLVTMPLG